MPFLNHGGLRLHYRHAGSGPLVILLPGNTASSTHFEREINHLSAACHVASLDFRGTGQSDRLDQFDQEWPVQSAGDVAALIEHFDQEQAVLIGTSGGAMVALLCAIHHSERVKAVIADSFVPHWSVEMLQACAAGRRLDDEPGAQFWSAGHGDDWRSVVENDTRWLLSVAANGGLDITPELSQIRCPVLLTGSLSDSLLLDIVSQSAAAVEALPDGELYLCREGDHPLIWSAPDRFWPVCDAFLNRAASKID